MALQPQRAGEPYSLCLSLVIANCDCYSLLFATTNHIERLDPALSRPGRMDVWVNFTYATKFQAEGIFKCFFPHKPTTSESEEAESTESTESESAPQEPKDPSQQNLPLPKSKPITNQLMFSEEEIAELAKRFADAIPENELSVGHLKLISIEVV